MKKVKVISKKKKGKATVFDIAVKNHHHYVLKDGVVSHNSYIPMDIIGGGAGTMYISSTILTLTAAQIKASGKVIGVRVMSKTEKSRDSIPKTKCPILLSFKNGMHPYSGLLDLALENGIWKKPGSKIELKDGTKVWEKEIMKDCEKYFTQEVMDDLNKICHEQFQYGSNSEDVAIEDGEIQEKKEEE